MATKKEQHSTGKKMAPGMKVGFIIMGIGCIILITSFILNKTMNYNPYTEPVTQNPTTIKETFSVPEDSKYSRAYHIYTYKESSFTRTYSKAMYDTHLLKDKDFKTEGGYVFQVGEKTYFTCYIYNLNNEKNLNNNLKIKLIHYNGTEATNLDYKIEELKPLEAKSIKIEVDKKALNAYDYKIDLY